VLASRGKNVSTDNKYLRPVVLVIYLLAYFLLSAQFTALIYRYKLINHNFSGTSLISEIFNFHSDGFRNGIIVWLTLLLHL